MERTYEEGRRDAELTALHERVNTIDIELKDGFRIFRSEMDTLKKALWMLYGGILLVGFVIPVAQKWFQLG
jgi:hypothetical protein